jgi:hypothetical protein
MTDDLNTVSITRTSAPLMQPKYFGESATFVRSVKSILRRAIVSSKRRGAWFSLDKKERGILSLAIRLEVKFSSMDFLRAITSVLKKLEEHGDTLYSRLRRGIMFAWAFSEFAVASGNAAAHEWRHDRNYAEYLGRVFSGGSRGSSIN